MPLPGVSMSYVAEKENKSAVGKSNIFIPVQSATQGAEVLPLALKLIGEGPAPTITLVAVTPLEPDTPLGEGAAPAQQLRNELDKLSEVDPLIRRLARSIVSHEPWQDIKALITEDLTDETLIVLPWHSSDTLWRTGLAHVLNDPPCDVAVVHSPPDPPIIRRILLPVRGGPFAVLSLQIAVRIARAVNAEITLLRVLSDDDNAASQFLREGFTGLSDIFPEITNETQVVGDPGRTILGMLKDHQAVVLGASATQGQDPIGLVASLILQKDDITTVVVKTKEPFRLPSAEALAADSPVLVRVERWFAQNTLECSEFADAKKLVDLKREQGIRISLGLASLNNETTIGNIIGLIRDRLLDSTPLLDELVLIDNGSVDASRRIATAMNVPSYATQDVLSAYGTLRGKGDSLWKSLYLLSGDLIVWMDTDIANPDPGQVLGIIGPLLMDPRIQYVKGFYGASAQASHGESDPITELLIRPMISLLFPELSGIASPLAGTHGGRRSALEQIPFYSGYGAAVGLLLDVLDQFGLESIAQVDLGAVTHRKTCDEPKVSAKTAFSILQLFAQQLDHKGVMNSELSIERTMKLLHMDQHPFHMEEVDVHEQRHPAMVTVREYRGRHLSRLS
jgi:hypothetical protein